MEEPVPARRTAAELAIDEPTSAESEIKLVHQDATVVSIISAMNVRQETNMEVRGEQLVSVPVELLQQMIQAATAAATEATK